MVFLKNKRLGRQTVAFTNPPSIAAGSCVVGQKEGEGPLVSGIDYIETDAYAGEKNWEAAESAMQTKALQFAMDNCSEFKKKYAQSMI